MDSNNKYGRFDRQTLLRYLKKELSPEDTWKVEKAMQDDPFLAEAMEGLEAAERFGVLSEDLEWLRKRMKKHRRRIKVPELPNLLNIAAVLIILLISAWLVIEISRNNSPVKNEVAMRNSNKLPDTSGTAAYNDAGTKQEKDNVLIPSPSKSKVLEREMTEEDIAEDKKSNVGMPVETPGKENNPAAGPVLNDSAGNPGIDKNENSGLQPVSPENALSVSSESAGSGVASSRDLTGAGNLSENRSEKNKEKAGKRAAADIEKSYVVNTPSYTEPHPVSGDSSYNEYVLKNLHYPGQALKNNTEGVVFLQFTVDADSTVQDIVIISGPGNGCRDEAVRLLKEGPKWIPATSSGKPIKSRALYKINFKIKT
jgi:hypothetical protein